MDTHQAAGGDEQQICRRNHGKSWRCKNIRGDNKLQYCEKHYRMFTDFYTKNPSLLINSNKIGCLNKDKKEELEMQMKKNKMLPDEQFCCQNDGIKWRCKNLRMGHGDDHSVRKSAYCQKHYNYYVRQNKKKRRGASCSATGSIEEIRDSNFSKRRKKVTEVDDCFFEIQPPTSDPILAGGSPNIVSGEVESLTRIRESVVELGSLERCYKNLKKKKRIGDGAGCSATSPIEESRLSKTRKKVLEVDDCSLDVTAIQPPTTTTTDTVTEGGTANIKRTRENVETYGEVESQTETEQTVVELESLEHYKKVECTTLQEPSLDDFKKEKISNQEEQGGDGAYEHFCSHSAGIYRCKNFSMSHGAAADDPSVPKSRYCDKHYNYYKNRQSKKTSRDGEGAGAGTGIGPIETTDSNFPKLRNEVMEEHDCSLDVTGIQPAATDDFSDRIVRMRENVERSEKSVEQKSWKGITETVVELETLEHYKSKCFELSAELEKKKVECTTLHGKLVEVEEIRKTAAIDETERTPADATECWRKMFSDFAESMESRILDLENIVLRMDDKISSVEVCVESRISKLECLALRSGKGGSMLRCVQLRRSEKIQSEAQGLENDVTQNGEKLIDENDRMVSDVDECKTKEKVLNVYDAGSLRVSSEGELVEGRKRWGCSEERPSQHGSSSQDHLEMTKEPFVNLVSDDDSVEILGESEDSDCSTDSEHSLGTLMDMLAMKYRNRNQEKENKWKCEADMISSFEAEPDLCMKAVCALYQQQISEDEISDKGLLHNSDAVRCTTLAKFLMDGDCKGNLNKSVKELGMLDSEAVDDCKRLAKGYSTLLFSIYQNGKDPFSLPGTTGASHGDETAK